MTSTEQHHPGRCSDHLPQLPTGLLIGGQWRESTNDRFTVFDPGTGAALTDVADANIEDAAKAMDAAATAQSEWAATAPRERSQILRRAYDAVIASTEEFARLITLEMGKSLTEARGEVAYGAEFLRWFSEEAVRIDGRYTIAPNGQSRLLVTRKPVGPCLMITPWNFPLAMATRKVAPALAAGCTMIIKPSELTPLTTLRFAQVLQEAGVPDGVVNVLTTTHAAEVAQHLITDPRLRKVSFTGSTAVGRTLLAQASENVLRTSMELGGNAPFLVFEDADLDAAVQGAVAAKLRNIGEACTAANRFYVHESVEVEFTSRLADEFTRQRIGHGTAPDTDLGPLINESARTKVEALVDDAIRRGATIVTGGTRKTGPGWFYEPTVLNNVPSEADIMSHEIFGPVAPICTFRNENQAIDYANNTQYGLIAYAYTRDAARMLRLPERLETGMLGINSGVISNPAAPFGGVKQSGLGREGGHEGMDEYLDTMYVGIADPTC
ncbi:NAD-dependent succinate-semialdehyde dehydrogenase [Tsukamurella tyrosinosolvens]|uniref:NAD-dependent succinate-semialdehyde dehydrogenase n=1 Tax=Tsukamurella tyrosinosolvens TaxID=57704 RepID=UPI000C7EB861|nr:NAD-dependent succinate-semialdehyde dehydrogenase [Tsukamurella tyrosinosolvens]AUN41852.1 NAD-dependent succinate-semialdehyde dehydrogenase [Tsukamurella tyrosinosolvens]